MAKEYIERDKIALTDFEIATCGGDYKEWLKLLLNKIEHLPAADVAPVVRCKDCVYHYYNVDGAGMCELGIGNALLDDDFCIRGIQKDGAKMEA